MTRRVANAWNGLRLPIARVAAVVAAVVLAGCAGGEPNTRHSPEPRVAEPAVALRLPTGARLDSAGRSIAVGNMPMGAVLAPDGRHLVVSLSGWREQGIEVVDLEKGRVVQRVAQPGAFLGLAWSPDGDRLYVSGGVSDCVYVYGWRAADREPATLVDSLALAPADPKTPGSRYPAGMAMSSDGHYLFVAENMSDSLAVLDLRSAASCSEWESDRTRTQSRFLLIVASTRRHGEATQSRCSTWTARAVSSRGIRSMRAGIRPRC